MKYIQRNPNPSGAYPPPQSGEAPGLLELTEEQAALVIQYNGYVTLSVEGDTVTVTPNMEAWEAWKAEQADKPAPEAAPTPEEQLRADVDYLAAMTGVML